MLGSGAHLRQVQLSSPTCGCAQQQRAESPEPNPHEIKCATAAQHGRFPRACHGTRGRSEAKLSARRDTEHAKRRRGVGWHGSADHAPPSKSTCAVHLSRIVCRNNPSSFPKMRMRPISKLSMGRSTLPLQPSTIAGVACRGAAERREWPRVESGGSRRSGISERGISEPGAFWIAGVLPAIALGTLAVSWHNKIEETANCVHPFCCGVRAAERERRSKRGPRHPAPSWGEVLQQSWAIWWLAPRTQHPRRVGRAPAGALAILWGGPSGRGCRGALELFAWHSCRGLRSSVQQPQRASVPATKSHCLEKKGNPHSSPGRTGPKRCLCLRTKTPTALPFPPRRAATVFLAVAI